jgi:homoserine dehydrogenase
MTQIKFEVGSQKVDISGEPRTQHAALLLGYGQVNQAVAACLERERDRLRAFGCEVAPTRALVRDLTKRRGGPYVTLSNDAHHVIDTPVDIVIEALGGIEPARSLVTAALEAGIPVVSANKTLVAAHGRELRRLAATRGTRFSCDAAVLAGVPFLGSLERRPLVSAATRIEAILNGTTHFIMSAIARGATFNAALADASARGYAEPDSRADISGRDAAEKLTVLLHLAGCDVAAEDLPRLGIDAIEPDDLAAARRAGGTIKPVALASLEDGRSGAWVGPAFVAEEHPLARLDGVTNALRIKSANTRCTFSGPGAGPAVTAATIVDDVVEILTSGPRWPGARTTIDASRRVPLDQPPAGRWFLRVAGADRLTSHDVAEFLAVRRAPAVRLDDRGDRFTCVTAAATWSTINDVVTAVRAGGARAIAIPVIEGGDDD